MELSLIPIGLKEKKASCTRIVKHQTHTNSKHKVQGHRIQGSRLDYSRGNPWIFRGCLPLLPYHPRPFDRYSGRKITSTLRERYRLLHRSWCGIIKRWEPNFFLLRGQFVRGDSWLGPGYVTLWAVYLVSQTRNFFSFFRVCRKCLYLILTLWIWLKWRRSLKKNTGKTECTHRFSWRDSQAELFLFSSCSLCMRHLTLLFYIVE